ncbi:TPA: hypothetical protein ACGHEU_004687 [Escherichia coli]
MSQSPYDDEFRAIRYIQLRGQDIANAHETINSDIESLKAQLTGLISGTELDEAEHLALKGVRLENGNFPTLSVLSLTSDFVPLSANP